MGLPAATGLDFYREWGADAARRGANPIPLRRNGRAVWRDDANGEAWLAGYEAELAALAEGGVNAA